MTERFMQKTIVVWGGALLACFLWGSAFPCIKIGYKWMAIESSDIWTQILCAGYRFTLAGIIAIIIASFMHKRFIYPSKKAFPKVVKLCMLQTVLQYFFFYIGLAHTTGVKASIIEGMNVFVAILVASLIFHTEKLTLRKVVGCVLGCAGVILVNVSGNSVDMSFSLLGEGFIFFSALSYAFSSIAIKKYTKEENPLMLSGWQFVVGGLIMIAMGLVMGGDIPVWTGRGIAMLVYLSFVSAIAYSLWSMLLKYNPISRIAVFGFMNPVFGFILSIVLLGEGNALNISAVIAMVLVCAGIYIVNRKSTGDNGNL